MLWSEITVSWNEFRVANLFGTGTYIVPAFVLLAVLGLAFVRVDRFTVSAFLGRATYFIATLTYAFVDGRFYLPLFLLWLRWRFYLLNGQFLTLSSCASRFRRSR